MELFFSSVNVFWAACLFELSVFCSDLHLLQLHRCTTKCTKKRCCFRHVLMFGPLHAADLKVAWCMWGVWYETTREKKKEMVFNRSVYYECLSKPACLSGKFISVFFHRWGRPTCSETKYLGWLRKCLKCVSVWVASNALFLRCVCCCCVWPSAKFYGSSFIWCPLLWWLRGLPFDLLKTFLRLTVWKNTQKMMQHRKRMMIENVFWSYCYVSYFRSSSHRESDSWLKI